MFPQAKHNSHLAKRTFQLQKPIRQLPTYEKLESQKMTHPTILYNTTDRFNLSYVYRLSIICTVTDLWYRPAQITASESEGRLQYRLSLKYVLLKNRRIVASTVKTQVKLDFNETVSRDLYTFFFQIHYICVLSWHSLPSAGLSETQKKKEEEEKMVKKSRTVGN